MLCLNCHHLSNSILHLVLKHAAVSPAVRPHHPRAPAAPRQRQRAGARGAAPSGPQRSRRSAPPRSAPGAAAGRAAGRGGHNAADKMVVTRRAAARGRWQRPRAGGGGGNPSPSAPATEEVSTGGGAGSRAAPAVRGGAAAMFLRARGRAAGPRCPQRAVRCGEVRARGCAARAGGGGAVPVCPPAAAGPAQRCPAGPCRGSQPVQVIQPINGAS